MRENHRAAHQGALGQLFERQAERFPFRLQPLGHAPVDIGGSLIH